MLKFYNLFVLLTLVLFYLGPIPWWDQTNPRVGLYVGLCMLLFNVGAYFGIKSRTVSVKSFPFPQSNRAAYALILIFTILSFLNLFSITQKNPLEISSYSLDFGQVFAEFSENVRYRSTGLYEYILTILKAICFPFVLLIFADRFGRDWIAVGAILAPLIISSLLRGTDKEIFDVMLLVGVTAYYRNLLGWRVLLYGSLVPIFFSLFLVRRLGRFSGSLPACLPDSNACFNYSSFLARVFGPDAEIIYVFVAHYLTQGYQALALSFKFSYDFNFFVGHLPPVKRSFCIALDYICNRPEYQEKLQSIGWDTSAHWTSVYPILANDFSFWLVPFYFLLLGSIYRRSVTFWENSRDIASLVALILITNFIVFSSANMQIAISLDWAISLILIVYVGLMRRQIRST